MKAITREKYGPPELLKIQEVEKPVPMDHEVLVRVHAATINRTDCGILWAKPFLIRFFTGLLRPRSPIPGTDFAGEVTAIGKAVTAFKVGDRVWGFEDEGLASHAEYMTFAADGAIARIPDGITYEQAVASAEGAHYARNFINKVKLEKGQHIMVYGATGAIGSAAVQLLKYYGLQVTAVCATPHVEAVRALGADRVIDYLKEDFTQDLQRYQFVFDAVGKSTFGACKHLLVPRGIYISSELGPYAQNIYFALFTPLFRGKKVIFPIPTQCKVTIELMTQLLQEGRFKPLVDRRYAMEQIVEAYDYVASGKKIGNVILQIQ
jgi:NADPH:quinone reductase-like Zn-dependent oxidoreductase